MIRRDEYQSGLRLVTEQVPGVRSVALGLWVAVGSRDEPPRIAGGSHFLEHLLFKGTKTRTAKDIAEAFDAVGGELNAFTAKESTTFYARVLDRDVPMAVEFLTDMLQNSLIRKSDVDAERQVILEEINMHEDSPDELVHDLFGETLWSGHPLGRPVLGSVETIRAATRDQIRRFWKARYLPRNVVVVAAGNLEHDEVARLVESHLETGKKVTKGSARLRPDGGAPAPSGEVAVKRRQTEQAHICFGTAGLAQGDPRRFAFQVVNDAIGGGMASRLFQEVREKRGLVYSIYSYHSMYAETGMFRVYAGTTPARAKEVLEITTRELDDVAEKGLTPDELDRAKGHLKGSLVLSLEDTGSRMSRLGRSEVSQGEILTVDEVIERIDAVTAEDTQEVAEQVLGQPRSLAVIGPFKKNAFADVGRLK
ncbi:MAG: M16 family metallopeptidase [Actinomycetota bacterium]